MDPLWHSLRAEEFKTFNHKDRWQKRFLDESHLQLVDGARGFSPLRDQIRVPLMVLMGMVGLLVLMTCVNVSSLLLVRAAGRAREISVRYALGAGRWQIVRQLLMEGVFSRTAGRCVGSRDRAGRVAGSDSPFAGRNRHRIALQALCPDMRVFSFRVRTRVHRVARVQPRSSAAFPEAGRREFAQAADHHRAAGKSALPSLPRRRQIALSLLLLIGAGLFVRTLRNLQSVDLGFTADHLLGFNVNPRLAGYQPDQVTALNRRILNTLSALPGVRAVAATDDPDLAHNNDNGNIHIVGYSAREDEDMQAEQPWVTPQYFATMQVPVQAGVCSGDETPARQVFPS